MCTFEEVAQMLDEIVEELPSPLLEGLNGGIVLLPYTRHNSSIPSDKYYVLGTYHSTRQMGKWIELYYGSFSALYGYYPPERLKAELTHVVHHELRHHVETRAGCDDLAREDAAYVAEALQKISHSTPSTPQNESR